MFKKIFISGIAASLLFSIPLRADHHHHSETIELKLAEAKAKEKSTGAKVFGGSMQAVNKLAWLASAVPAVLAYFVTAPAKNSDNFDHEQGRAIIIAGITYIISYPVIKAISGAAISQEGDKPLKK